MNKGRKQSPFIGRRVPLVDDGVPILYPRYKEVSEILLDGGKKKRPAPEDEEQQTAAALAAAATNGGEAPAAATEQPAKKSKKEKKQQQQEAAAGAATANGVEAAAPAAAAAAAEEINPFETDEAKAVRLRREEKARKKREKQAKRAAELAAEAAATQAAAAAAAVEAQEAPEQQQQQQQAQEDKGNAEEAARIRSVLGFTTAEAAAAAAAKEKAAAAAAAKAPKVPPPSTAFTFNFSGLASTSAEARVAAETEAKLAAIQAVTAADKDGFIPRRVFVGGMPYSYSREQVAEYWGWCGEIDSLDMMTFPDSGRFRGIAFITFASQEAADSALQYNGEQLEGQTLKVERCKAAAAAKQMKVAAAAAAGQRHGHNLHHHQQQQQQAPAAAAESQPAAAAASGAGVSSSGGPGKTAGYNVAYVGNIAFEAGPDDIKQLFEDCGVTKVRLHTDKHSGKSKGYAHVHFADEAGLDKALALSGCQLHGRGIKVSYGQPKKN